LYFGGSDRFFGGLAGQLSGRRYTVGPTVRPPCDLLNKALLTEALDSLSMPIDREPRTGRIKILVSAP